MTIKQRRLHIKRTVMLRVSFVLIALVGVGAALVALSHTDEDPLTVLLDRWPVVLAAGLLYTTGMCVYAVSWAALFEREENRPLIALGFLISQPVKYLPGGVAQPIGQITLTAQAVASSRRAIVSFPVHVLINVIAALTLAAPFLFVADTPDWAGWLVILVPLIWVALDRRWMAGLLSFLSRAHRVFKIGHELPQQRRINMGFALALAAHGTLFASFGVLTAGTVPGWSVMTLSVAFAISWLIGYIAIPAPAGLGAREAVLAVLLSGAVTTFDVVKISAVHRIMTLVVELVLLSASLVVMRMFFKSGVEAGSGTRHSSDNEEDALGGTNVDARS
ncbi:MAG TPA: hypothetical protein VGC03_14865 [Acidimicrobiia bacterium]|jgi:hypothetical protein